MARFLSKLGNVKIKDALIFALIWVAAILLFGRFHDRATIQAYDQVLDSALQPNLEIEEGQLEYDSNYDPALSERVYYDPEAIWENRY